MKWVKSANNAEYRLFFDPDGNLMIYVVNVQVEKDTGEISTEIFGRPAPFPGTLLKDVVSVTRAGSIRNGLEEALGSLVVSSGILPDKPTDDEVAASLETKSSALRAKNK